MAVSCALGWHADKLLFLTDVAGVQDEAGQVLAKLTPTGARRLVSTGVAHGGMQAKLEAALSSLEGGLRGSDRRSGPASGHLPAAFGRRKFGDAPGAGGHMIGAPTTLEVHKASMRDIAPILELINSYAAKGIMLAAHGIRNVRAHPRFLGRLSGRPAGRLRRLALLYPDFGRGSLARRRA